MTDTVVVTNADETSEVAAAATEAVADAFRQGVSEGSMAQARENDGEDEAAALRREVADLRAELEQVRADAGTAVVVAEAAAAVAVDAAIAVDEDATEDADEGGDGGPKPPEPRKAPAEAPSAPPGDDKPARKAYGNPKWFRS